MSEIFLHNFLCLSLISCFSKYSNWLCVHYCQILGVLFLENWPSFQAGSQLSSLPQRTDRLLILTILMTITKTVLSYMHQFHDVDVIPSARFIILISGKPRTSRIMRRKVVHGDFSQLNASTACQFSFQFLKEIIIQYISVLFMLGVRGYCFGLTDIKCCQIFFRQVYFGAPLIIFWRLKSTWVKIT